ncbi:transposable element Tc1 transposase [Trichonephila clavipes]|uniref:Transposable element Tc1 transposase n=1 Tax=Trichonephila clavipes TaxID=2585209 RepID=A0A8X6RPM0_TRICX|nr:transposable element Tc1 transposase [Trichonephila clavipes]
MTEGFLRLAQFCEQESLTNDSRHTFLWRKPGTHYLPSNVQEIGRYARGGLMVRAGIKLDGHTHIHVFERGTATAVGYREEVYRQRATTL